MFSTAFSMHQLYTNGFQEIATTSHSKSNHPLPNLVYFTSFNCVTYSIINQPISVTKFILLTYSHLAFVQLLYVLAANIVHIG